MRIDKKIRREVDMYLKNSKDKMTALHAIKSLLEDILEDTKNEIQERELDPETVMFDN